MLSQVFNVFFLLLSGVFFLEHAAGAPTLSAVGPGLPPIGALEVAALAPPETEGVPNALPADNSLAQESQVPTFPTDQWGPVAAYEHALNAPSPIPVDQLERVYPGFGIPLEEPRISSAPEQVSSGADPRVPRPQTSPGASSIRAQAQEEPTSDILQRYATYATEGTSEPAQNTTQQELIAGRLSPPSEVHRPPILLGGGPELQPGFPFTNTNANALQDATVPAARSIQSMDHSFGNYQQFQAAQSGTSRYGEYLGTALDWSNGGIRRGNANSGFASGQPNIVQQHGDGGYPGSALQWGVGGVQNDVGSILGSAGQPNMLQQQRTIPSPRDFGFGREHTAASWTTPQLRDGAAFNTANTAVFGESSIRRREGVSIGGGHDDIRLEERSVEPTRYTLPLQNTLSAFPQAPGYSNTFSLERRDERDHLGFNTFGASDSFGGVRRSDGIMGSAEFDRSGELAGISGGRQPVDANVNRGPSALLGTAGAASVDQESWPYIVRTSRGALRSPSGAAGHRLRSRSSNAPGRHRNPKDATPAVSGPMRSPRIRRLEPLPPTDVSENGGQREPDEITGSQRTSIEESDQLEHDEAATVSDGNQSNALEGNDVLGAPAHTEAALAVQEPAVSNATNRDASGGHEVSGASSSLAEQSEGDETEPNTELRSKANNIRESLEELRKQLLLGDETSWDGDRDQLLKAVTDMEFEVEGAIKSIEALEHPHQEHEERNVAIETTENALSTFFPVKADRKEILAVLSRGESIDSYIREILASYPPVTSLESTVSGADSDTADVGAEVTTETRAEAVESSLAEQRENAPKKPEQTVDSNATEESVYEQAASSLEEASNVGGNAARRDTQPEDVSHPLILSSSVATSSGLPTDTQSDVQSATESAGAAGITSAPKQQLTLEGTEEDLEEEEPISTLPSAPDSVNTLPPQDDVKIMDGEESPPVSSSVRTSGSVNSVEGPSMVNTEEAIKVMEGIEGAESDDLSNNGIGDGELTPSLQPGLETTEREPKPSLHLDGNREARPVENEGEVPTSSYVMVGNEGSGELTGLPPAHPASGLLSETQFDSNGELYVEPQPSTGVTAFTETGSSIHETNTQAPFPRPSQLSEDLPLGEASAPVTGGQEANHDALQNRSANPWEDVITSPKPEGNNVASDVKDEAPMNFMESSSTSDLSSSGLLPSATNNEETVEDIVPTSSLSGTTQGAPKPEGEAKNEDAASSAGLQELSNTEQHTKNDKAVEDSSVDSDSGAPPLITVSRVYALSRWGTGMEVKSAGPGEAGGQSAQNAKPAYSVSPGSLRLQKELEDLDVSEHFAITFPDIGNIMKLNVDIQPDNGLWAGETVRFLVTVFDSYPFDPPKVKCLTKVEQM